MYKTFNEWKYIGCIPRKGEKSHTKDKNGIALFSHEQIIYNKLEYSLDEIFMQQLERECTNPNG